MGTMTRSLWWLLRKAGRCFDCFSWGTLGQGQFHCFLFLFLLTVVGLAWALLVKGPGDHQRKTASADCCTQQPATAGFTMYTAAPRVVHVGGVNSSAVGWAGSLGERVVWRTVSQSVRESSPRVDELLWNYPHLVVDVVGIWVPCPRLTVLVTTSPERRLQRDTIRSGWGRPQQYRNCTLRVIFFMSVVRSSPTYGAVKAEHRVFRDIVIQMIDGGHQESTASKAALLIEWVPGHVLGSQFVLRVTDDTLVQVPALMNAVDKLAAKSPAKSLYGRVSPDGGHLGGCTYMAKSDAFMRLQPVFAFERLDGDEGEFVTGRLARRAGLKLVRLEGIGPCHRPEEALLQKWLRDGNVNSSLLTLHGLQPREMQILHLILSQR